MASRAQRRAEPNRIAQTGAREEEPPAFFLNVPDRRDGEACWPPAARTGYPVKPSPPDAPPAGRAARPAALPAGRPVPGGPHLLRDGTPQGEEEAMKFFTAELLERYNLEDPA